MTTTLPLPTTPRTRPLPPDTGPCPGQLLVMVCDAALRYLVAAESAYAAGEPRAAAADIRNAQSILVELQAAADRAIGPEIADALVHVCQHLIDHLDSACAARDAALLVEARALLFGLRNAWTDAARASHPARTIRPSA